MSRAYEEAIANSRAAEQRIVGAMLAEEIEAKHQQLEGLEGRAWRGAQVHRLNLDFRPTRLPPDEELRNSIGFLRARGRELVQNNAYAQHYLDLLGTNVVGEEGIGHQALIRDAQGELAEDLNDIVEEGWWEYTEDPVTIDGKTPLTPLMHQLMKTWDTDGEAFVRVWGGFEYNRFGLGLEPIDADVVDETLNQINTPDRDDIVMGIQVGERREPRFYHAWDGPYTTSSLGRRRVPIPAGEIFHLYDPQRVNATRGVTRFAPVMEELHQLGGYEEAELYASRIAASAMGIWQERQNPNGVGPAQDLTNKGAGNPVTMTANPGSFGFAPPGYELARWTVDHPNTAFAEFIRAKLRKIASGLGVTYTTLTGDLSDINFSSYRAGLHQERKYWKYRQKLLISQFVRKLYARWMNWALLRGELAQLPQRDFGRLLKAQWTPPTWPSVSPLEDAQTAVLEIQWGLNSRTNYHLGQGRDRTRTIEDLKQEKKLGVDNGVLIDGLAVQPAPAADTAHSPDDPAKPTRKIAARAQVTEAIAATNGNGGHA